MNSVKARVLYLCEKNRTKIGTLERVTALSNGTIKKWTDDTVPNGQTLQAIADYFDISVDYLLGRTCDESPIHSDDEVNYKLANIRTRLITQPSIRILLDATEDASPEDMEKVVRIVQAMLDTKK